MEAQELKVERYGLTVVVSAPAGVDVWAAAKAAIEAAEHFSSNQRIEKRSVPEPSTPASSTSKRPSKADRVRATAYTLLKDGEWHERRELNALLRGEGISAPTVMASLKGRFEERRDGRGRVSYRDPCADPDGSEEDRRDFEDLCALVTRGNGGTADPTYLSDSPDSQDPWGRAGESRRELEEFVTSENERSNGVR